MNEVRGGLGVADRAPPALELRGVRVPFGHARGLLDVSLAVAHGERMVVVGPSGVGKTTLLRAVAGLTPVDDGRVLAAGEDVTMLPPERRGAVYLHQTPVLFPHLNVGENVAFPLRLRGHRGEAVRGRVREILVAVRLDGFEARHTHTLSGGQRHRVALARAIAARPAVLLLDEPLSALDPWLRSELRAAIVAAQAHYGPAMLLVTHDLEDAGALADRIAVLLDGRIAQIATPRRLFTRPATLDVARFLGTYQELTGRVRSDGAIDCALGVVAVPPAQRVTLPVGSSVVLAFRPESVRVGGAEDATLGVPARTVEVRYRPRGITVVARIEGSAEDVSIEGEATESTVAHAADGAVTIALDPRGVMIYPS